MAAAAPPRPVSAEYPRGTRGAAATEQIRNSKETKTVCRSFFAALESLSSRRTNGRVSSQRAWSRPQVNTFIDDLFAFVIKMPMMHRVSCFRDDLVFIIYLYQRHIYDVDMSRGIMGEDAAQ